MMFSRWGMMLLTYICLACIGGILILSCLYSPLHTLYVKKWIKFKEKNPTIWGISNDMKLKSLNIKNEENFIAFHYEHE